MMKAAEANSEDSVFYLLKLDPNTLCIDNFGRKARDYAKHYDKKSKMHLMLAQAE